jgi:hypothetical protein
VLEIAMEHTNKIGRTPPFCFCGCVAFAGMYVSWGSICLGFIEDLGGFDFCVYKRLK